MIPITTGAICEGSCLDWWEYGWIGIAVFLFIIWGITLILLIRRKKEVVKLKQIKLKQKLGIKRNETQIT